MPDDRTLRDGRVGASVDEADGRRLGESFADPNALDDAKIGRSFEEANASGKHKRHAPEQPKKPVNWRVLSLFVLVVLLVFLVAFFAGYLPRHRRDKENRQKADAERSALPVIEVNQVRRAESGATLVVPGTTTPLTEAFVYARAGGYLKRRLVDIGDHVRKGQLLAVIDAPDLDRQVDQAREQVRQAEAQRAQQETQLALARITVERYRVLVTKGVIARQEGDQREADFRAAQANVAAAERNVQAFRANLGRVIALQGYERVTAPFNGVVTARNVDVGALISAQGSGGSAPSASDAQSVGSGSGSSNTGGATATGPAAATPSTGGGAGGPLFSIAQVERLRILVSVPEGYANGVKAGQSAVLHFQEFPRAEFHGLVTRTSASIDQNTRTLLTEVQVDNRDGRLLTGMYAVVTFSGLGGQPPLTISGDAIAVRQDRNVVAVVDNGVVHIRPVEVGRDLGPTVEVVGGLREGELIAATFTDDVGEGARVQTRVAQNTALASGGAAGRQSAPPGGSTQYANPAITDANMAGQAGKQSGGKAGSAAGSDGGSGEQKGQSSGSSNGGGGGGGKP